MTDKTVGLSIRDAFTQAEAELALSEESGATDIAPVSEGGDALGEQPTVENSSDSGLFDTLDEDNIEAGDNQLPSEELYTVTVQGEEREITLQEALNGYMRQEDYTIKTTEAAEREREASKALTLMRMLEERPAETLRKLYQRINAGQPLDFEGTPSNTVQPTDSPDDIEALVEARVAEMLENDPRLVAIQQERALAEVESAFEKIGKDYGVKLTDADKQKVLVKAQETGNYDLESVFGAMYAKKLAADRARDLEKANLRKVSPLKGEGRADSLPEPKRPAKKYDNFRSALEEQLALEEQGIDTVPAL